MGTAGRNGIVAIAVTCPPVPWLIHFVLTGVGKGVTVNSSGDSYMTPTGVILDALAEIIDLKSDECEAEKLNCAAEVIAAFCLDSGMSNSEVRWEIRQRQAKVRIAQRCLARMDSTQHVTPPLRDNGVGVRPV